MVFNNPDAFWLVLLIPAMIIFSIVIAFFHRRDRRRFAHTELYDALTRSVSKTKQRIRKVLYMLGMFFLILAFTEPRFGTKTEIVKRMGLDIVIALDTSYSMLAEDIKPNRIMQAKYEIHRFIDNLKGDRIALLAFAGKTFVQCPLTTDYAAAKTLLDNIDIGIISEPGTNIGEAIKGSVRLLEKGSEADSESQLIILFTDGENLTGDPEDAAKKAASKSIRIFTVGIGTPGGEIIPIRNDKGNLEDYKKDSEGNVVKTFLDEKNLMRIADITRSTYLNTADGEVNIQMLIDQLGTMQKKDIYERKISRLKERYQIPLGISLMFFLVWLILGERRSEIPVFRWRTFT